MKCIRPLKASQNEDGDIVYSSRKAAPGLVGFEFECRKCLPCRLNQAREKAVRCYHQSKMHEENIFLTLTYNEEKLTSDRLVYRDFQLFIKKLRGEITRKHITAETKLFEEKGRSTREAIKEQREKIIKKYKINYMVTGEYGEENKRPHWHAIIFNYSPSDKKPIYKNERGDQLYGSEILTKIWGKGNIDFGEVTMDSANYVARYAAKKLVHGKDQDHNYHPIHKTSSLYGIGRQWIEKYWKHTFENGYINLPGGIPSKIPRYYVDWCKKHKESVYMDYITEVRPYIQAKAEKKSRKEEMNHLTNIMNYKGGRAYPMTQNGVSHRILQKKFKQLQENLKL